MKWFWGIHTQNDTIFTTVRVLAPSEDTRLLESDTLTSPFLKENYKF